MKSLLVGLWFCLTCISLHAEDTIVILKWATHPALDEVEEAFVKNVKLKLPSGETLQIERRNANANMQRAKEIAEATVRKDVRLLVTFGTPATQAVVQTESAIPILFAAVSDPAGAGIQTPRTAGIRNVSPAVIKAGFDLISLLYPTAKTVGTIFNPSEQNSVFVQNLMKAEADRRGWTLLQRRISDPERMTSVADALLESVDVIYCANDNSVNLKATSLASVARERRKGFIIGETSAITKGPLAAIGVDYTWTGAELAKMANLFLSGSETIATLGIKDTTSTEALISVSTAAAIKVTVPSAPGIKTVP